MSGFQAKKTLRECDFSDDDGGILERLKQSREALGMRRETLSEWSLSHGQQQESAEIDYIAGWLEWLQFGGIVPYWIAVEESRQPGERMLQV